MNLSGGIDNLGPIRQPLAVYLAIVFVCIYFAIWKGVKSTGKVSFKVFAGLSKSQTGLIDNDAR